MSEKNLSKLKDLRNTLKQNNEELLISLAPKLEAVDIDEIIKRKGLEIRHNSFLEPTDEKQYRKSNAMPPLGYSSVHRIGRG